jgi:hypothetical protein
VLSQTPVVPSSVAPAARRPSADSGINRLDRTGVAGVGGLFAVVPPVAPCRR